MTPDEARHPSFVLVLDTETTGLRGRASAAQDARLVQLAWMLFDDGGRCLERTCLLIRPDGFEIPAEASRVHGITTSRALREGITCRAALDQLARAAARASVVVGHNIGYDIAVLEAEFARLGISSPLVALTAFCTMEAGTPLCALPGKSGHRWPRLAELHEKLFGERFANAHDALADVEATARCYYEMRLRGASTPPPAPSSTVPPTLTDGQAAVLEALDQFVRGEDACFILSGAAGAGKTFLIRHAISRMQAAGYAVRILAPTGRAARVASRRAEAEASTIHQHIYQFEGMKVEGRSEEETRISIRFARRPNNELPRTIYIVDEASMVPDHAREDEDTHLHFGSGRVLSDLVRYAGLDEEGCSRKLVFVGDGAQLPPVTDAISPAMSADYLRTTFGLEVTTAELTEIVRQKADSGILGCATPIRSAITEGRFHVLDIAANEDVRHAREAVDTFAEVAKEVGLKRTVIITHSNRVARDLNEGVRQLRFNSLPPVRRGDRLIVVHNNYAHDLLNGDLVDVVSASDEVEVRRPLRGVRLVFRDVELRLEDDPSRVVHCKLLDDFLTSEDGSLQPDLLQALVVDFTQRHRDLKPNTSEFEKRLRDDLYFNAIRAKYGYAITCHKAQGGEWHSTVVVFDGRSKGWDNEHYFRWTYTALTRASDRLHAVHAPRHATGSGLEVVSSTPVEPTRTSMNIRDLEDAIHAAGATITERRNMPYRHRIVLAMDGRHAHADIIYNGKNVITGVAYAASFDDLPGAAALKQALTARIGTSLGAAGNAEGSGKGDAVSQATVTFPEGSPHLEEFYRFLCERLDGSGISIAGVEHMQWCERYTFANGDEPARVDFYYNGKGRFTRINAVRPGTLATRIEQLLADR